MIKTSTSVNPLNYAHSGLDIPGTNELEKKDVQFYDSLRPHLDQLAKDPSDDVIAKILAYSSINR
ncbi:hypothetical protein [Pedobacter metabolipauper]|uniref:Uncharacterized protein n=1 Tax=Pedobacter metabolipauper TaxID=425513 RepID=A0A4R6STR5_9SPHI|nr:hypothetical protein [Pedobacter metabolipauper]TDQ08855.1 hypothetical protein ATK78_3374 [Pedobacter metabolipauper]